MSIIILEAEIPKGRHIECEGKFVQCGQEGLVAPVGESKLPWIHVLPGHSFHFATYIVEETQELCSGLLNSSL